MFKIFVISLLCFFNFLLVAQQTREEKLQQLQKRSDIKVTAVDKDILKLEYPNGKVLYKSIGEYITKVENRITYSPTFDSTIIDLTTIDTTLYYQKYKFWQEVPIHNWDFNFVRIGDVNNNGKPELYGPRKFFNSDYEPVTIYELNSNDGFDSIYQYDSVGTARNIYDVDGDGKEDVHLTTQGMFGPFQQRFFSKPKETSLATDLGFIFSPYPEQFPQLNNQTLGDFDGDGNTDLLFSRSSTPYVYIFEYNPFINNFDSVYRFEAEDGKGGFSVDDFDLDGKTDMVFGTINGNVYVLENKSDNQYYNSWQGNVEGNNAYIHTWTNDIDKNGKPEFWVLADAYYNGIGTTRITIFESDGDNSYQAVGRIDLVGIMSFYAGNMQTIDVDNDGSEEVAVCIDDNFLILKFNGSENHHTYEVYYIKRNELTASGENSVYFGATMNDLLNNGKNEILISMDHIINQGAQTFGRRFTKIYRPDSTTSVNQSDDLIPNSISLNQNYPNPFNPVTNIKFELNKSETVSIKIYNILGKEIKLLVQEELPSGEYSILWSGKDDEGNSLPSGIYFIQMKAGKYQQTIKSVLLK